MVILGGRAYASTSFMGPVKNVEGGRCDVPARAPELDLVPAGSAVHAYRIVQIFESG
jgi:hypothetical protein